jgi:tetratricopeptide (TPR) repeat protein
MADADGAHTALFDRFRHRWHVAVLAAGAVGGLIAVGQVFDVLDRGFSLYERTLELMGSKYCHGRPIDELRASMWRNINSGGTFYSVAREQANNLLECRKEDSNALTALGAVEFYGGRYSEAEQLFRRAIKSKPTIRAHHLNFADTLVELGRYEAALSKYQDFDDGSVVLSYKKARVHLLASDFGKARDLLATISSDFGDEAKPGKARILEAAALVGLARQQSGQRSDQLLVEARRNFVEGLNKDRSWWVEVLTGRSNNRYEPFTKVGVILGNKISEWIEGDN